MAANLQLVVSAVNHASGTLKDVGRDADSLSGKLGTGLKVAGLAAAAGIGIAVVAGIDFVKQAMEEEAGIKRLAAAIDANGGSWANQGAAIEAAIKAREKLSFSDDDLRSSLAMLTAQTGSVDEAMSRQTVAMDLARGANIDLGSASKLLGKVTDESHGALSRLGIVVDKDADSMEVMAAVQARFGGQAEAFAGTAAGKWARVGIAFDNIKEVIGGALLPVVTALADKLATFLEEHEDDIKRIAEDFVAWATEAIPKVVQGIQDIANEVGPLLEKLQPLAEWFINNKTAITAAVIAMGAVIVAMFLAWAVSATAAAVATIAAAAPVIALIAVIALLAAGIFLLIKHWDEVTQWVREHMTVVLAVAAAIAVLFPPLGILIALIALAIKHWDTIQWVINHLVIPAFHAVMSVINNVVIPAISALVGFISGTLLPAFARVVQAVSDVASWLQGALVGAFNTAKSVFEGAVGVFNKPFNTAKHAVEQLVDWIQKLIDKINDVHMPDLTPGFNVPGIPGFQHGGFIPRGVNTLAMLHGPEWVIPAGRGMGGGGGITIVYSPAFSNASMTEVEQFSEWVTDAVRRKLGH